MSTGRTLYILYNANGSIMGKLSYGYRKLRRGSDTHPPCSACDLTHGGLSLKESDDFLGVKAEIEKEGVKVVQLHRDELTKGLKVYIPAHNVQYPAALIGRGAGDAETFEVVLDREALRDCAGEPKKMLAKLRESGAVGGAAHTASL